MQLGGILSKNHRICCSASRSHKGFIAALSNASVLGQLGVAIRGGRCREQLAQELHVQAVRPIVRMSAHMIDLRVGSWKENTPTLLLVKYEVRSRGRERLRPKWGVRSLA